MPNPLTSVLNFKRGEAPLVFLSAVFFFCVLCGYFMVRPFREAMGASGGMWGLYWLFGVTSVVSLLIVLAFGGLVSRVSRRKSIPIGYLFVVAGLAGFAALLIVNVRRGGGLIGADTETVLARTVAYGFFVWLSAINLFVNALFWAYMVDIFSVEQGKRVFPFIGIGGTLGAITASWLVGEASDIAGTFALVRDLRVSLGREAGPAWADYLPSGSMLVGALLFLCAIVVMLVLDRAARRSAHSRLGEPEAPEQTLEPEHSSTSETGLGGRYWDGLVQVASSAYMLGIAAFILLLAIANTLIYFTQAELIIESSDGLSQMVSKYADLDMLAQIATLIVQTFVTTHLIRRIGVGWTLAILPLVTLAGFVTLAIWPVFGVLAIFQAVHRATRYAVARPARETLFAAVTPEEKYKAKPVVDVFLYRAGDLAGMLLQGVLSLLGTITLMAGAVVPLAAGWCMLSVALGKAQQRKVDERSDTGV